MALYFFTDAGGGRKLIADSNINFTGAWSGSHAYAARDAAADGFGHNWLALVSNTGVALPSTFVTGIPTTWSHLVLKEPAPPSEEDQAFALAEAALETAWAGTAAATYALFQTGTLSANLALGYSGSHSYWVSTNGLAFDTKVFVNNGLVVDAAPPLP